MTEKADKANLWSTAGAFAAHYGPIPSSFSTLIRGLCIDSSRNNDVISVHNLAAMLRFLNAPSMLSPFYFYLKTFKPANLKGQPISYSQLIQEYRASELASFLTLLYLYRRTRKLVEDPAEKKIIAEQARQHSEIAALIAYRLNQIEPELAILVGGLRHLTWASLLARDLKAFQEYRRYIKKHNLIADSNYEFKTFGVTTAAIAAHLLILMGYPKEMALSFGEGMMCEELPDRHERPGEYNVVLTELWIDSLLKTDNAPDIQDQYTFPIEQEALDQLLKEIQPAKNGKTDDSWLDRSKADLTADNCPELFTTTTPSTDTEAIQSGEDVLTELE